MKFSFRFDIVKFSLCTTNKERWIFTNIYYFYLSVPIRIDQDWEKLFCRRCLVYKWVPTYSTIIAIRAECDTLIRIIDIGTTCCAHIYCAAVCIQTITREIIRCHLKQLWVSVCRRQETNKTQDIM